MKKGPIRITDRHMASSEALDDFVNARAAKLDRIHDGIVSCQVTLDMPHRHHRHGGHYQVGIVVIVPHATIVISRKAAADARMEDLYSAIDLAFQEVGRRVDDYAGRRREYRATA